MKLGKPAKILVLLLTLLPLIYIVLFVASFTVAFNSPAKNDPIFRHFGLFMAVHMGMMLLMFALLAFYVVFLFKSRAVKNDMKALWAVVLFFGGPIAMTVFWFLYVWRSEETPVAAAVGAAQ